MNAEQRRIANELLGIARDMAEAGLALTVQDGHLIAYAPRELQAARGGRAAGWALRDIETRDAGLPFVDNRED